MPQNTQDKNNTERIRYLESRVAELEKEILEKNRNYNKTDLGSLNFRLLTENVAVGIFQTDEHGTTTYVNPYWCKISGISYEEALGDGWLSAVHPDDRYIIASNWKKKSKEEEQSSAEYRFLKPDGTITWVTGQAIPYKNNNGEITGYIGTITDITQQKRIEEALNNNLEVEKLISVISSKFINVDLKRINNEINRAIEVIGRHINIDRSYVFLISDCRKFMSNTHEWCNKGIEPQKYILQRLPLTEFPWWIEKLSSLQTIHIDNVDYMPNEASAEKEILKAQNIKSVLVFPMIIDNELNGFLGFDSVNNFKKWEEEETLLLKLLAEIFVNALKRISTEQRIRKSEERNKAIVEALPDLFFRLDKKMVLLDCSKQYNELFYIPYEAFLGKKLNKILPPKVAKLAAEKIDKAFKTNKLQIFYYPLTIKGSERWFEARVLPAGKNEILALVRDITSIRRQQKILEQKNEELERYTYTVSHDLKSPLITVKGFATFLIEDIKNNKFDNLQKDLSRIIQAADKMSTMLEEILEISKAGQIVKAHESIPLKQIVDEVLNLLSIVIKQKNATIKVSGNLPSIIADKNRIKDVFQNLIENALKYSKEDTNPVINIGCKKQRDKTVVFVKDNGIGMKPELTEKIFGLFTKLQSNTKGTGIGLAISKRIIEAHNGKIWAESAGPGKGSAFYFYIPNVKN